MPVFRYFRLNGNYIFLKCMLVLIQILISLIISNFHLTNESTNSFWLAVLTILVHKKSGLIQQADRRIGLNFSQHIIQVLFLC